MAWIKGKDAPKPTEREEAVSNIWREKNIGSVGARMARSKAKLEDARSTWIVCLREFETDREEYVRLCADFGLELKMRDIRAMTEPEPDEINDTPTNDLEWRKRMREDDAS